MKYALIGCGRISANHIKAAVFNHFDIVAICDLIPDKMDALLEKYGLIDSNIKKYTDYAKMLDDNSDLQLVSIATSSDCHASIALDVIRHDINVIIEKPMALSIQDADKIIEEEKKHGVIVSVCHQNRFNIAIQKTRKAFECGFFGKISHGSINVRWNRNKDYYDQAKWRGKWASDGGALMNQCIHGIDLLRWMLGNEINEVYGFTKRQFHPYLECEDVGVAVVKFKNGSIGTIEGTVNVYPKNLEETLLIFGEKGTVKVGGQSTNTIDFWNFKESDDQFEGFEEETQNIYGNGHTSLFADVQRSVIKKEKPYITSSDGKAAVELVLAIYKSSFSGKPVKLPLTNCSTLDFVGSFSDK